MVQRNSRPIGGVYQVGQVITSGPFLTTYTAYNRNTSDVVGLLVIDLPPAFDPHAAEQLLAPLTRRRPVQSPHVLHVYDWGISEGQAYIATDPPRGITLRQLTDAENISLARSLTLAIQMTRGVAALQGHGIVDTDLRPQLITVDTIIGQDDRVQIDDVGLRTIFRQLGYVQGQNIHDIEYLDPRYMPPESIYQGIIGSSSDVYQLGILLFELITGRPPFVGRTPAETGIMQSNQPVPRMIQFKHDTPPGLQEIVDRAMAKYPLERYPHAAAMLAALEALPRPGRTAPSRQLPVTAPAPAGIPLPNAGSIALTSEMMVAADNKPVEAIDTVIGNERIGLHELLSDSLLPEDAKIYAFLDLEKAGEETQRIPLTEKYIIVGRLDPKRGITPEIDLTPFDPQATVSRQHARIRFEKTFFYIEDLKSRNKTRLRELVLMPFKAELLEHGDVICFGSVKLVFRIPGRHDTPVPQHMP
jgi:serine/threonine protein kinase